MPGPQIYLSIQTCQISSKILFPKLQEILKNEIKPRDFGNEQKDKVHLYTFIMTYLDHLKSSIFFCAFYFFFKSCKNR